MIAAEPSISILLAHPPSAHAPAWPSHETKRGSRPRLRITSYNVCYTKLLRLLFSSLSPPVALSARPEDQDRNDATFPSVVAYRVKCHPQTAAVPAKNRLGWDQASTGRQQHARNLQTSHRRQNPAQRSRLRGRITSYNVCYTKLLRSSCTSMAAARMAIMNCRPCSSSSNMAIGWPSRWILAIASPSLRPCRECRWST